MIRLLKQFIGVSDEMFPKHGDSCDTSEAQRSNCVSMVSPCHRGSIFVTKERMTSPDLAVFSFDWITFAGSKEKS